MELTQSNPDLVPQEHGLGSTIGTRLHRFIHGFQEGVFQEEVDEFVRTHADKFAVVCPDGSYPLEWTSLHSEYKELFDQQLEAILWFQDSNKEDFLRRCLMTQEASESLAQDTPLPDIFPDDPTLPESRNITVAEFQSFMSALTASEDFNRFLQVMFAAANGTLRTTVMLEKQTLQSQDAGEEIDSATPLNHEIEVTVPDGMVPGQTIVVEFLGRHYELVVPEGIDPGRAFHATVTI
eukprot:TRINITY_DN28436_c0_g1_i1.p1 TRINITY_DN28436_c0_g1~~TRINITY_DN28436_c0_g1_i1.p1  ORF type:complete len:237 (+),score=41.04 TRINITY_DN28436_c0_g1_i1:78-788(+)